MEFEFVPFAHDYYIITLPDRAKQISQLNHNTLFGTLQYQNMLDYANRPVAFAPVIRLFGYHVPTGVRTCVHVHGYLPYFYIKVQELSQLFMKQEFIIKFIDDTHRAYQITYFQQFNKQIQDKFKIIYNYELVLKYDFYGAHFEKEYFLKLYLYDQQYMKQLVQLYASGAIMNYKFQAYESHLTYFTHFYSDLFIFGMSQIIIQEYKHRRRLQPDLEGLLQGYKQYIEFIRLTTSDQYSNLYKLSGSLFELDCNYQVIVNQKFQNYKESLALSNIVKEMDTDISNKFQIRSLSQRLSSQKQLIEEFNVQLTLTLNKLWQDEESCRDKLGIADKLLLLTDMTKNKENNQSEQYPSINMIDLDPKYRTVLKMHLDEYILMKNKPKQIQLPDKCFINEEICKGFFTGQQEEKELCKKSIMERFREYVHRKKDLLEMIKEQGNMDYEYDFDRKNEEFDDDIQQVLDEELEQQNEEDIQDIMLMSQKEMSEQPNVFEVMKQNQKTKDKQMFRKKYKANKNNLKHSDCSIFEVCQFCSKNNIICVCQTYTHKQTTQLVTVQHTNNLTNSQRIYQYAINPPSADDVCGQINKKQNSSIHQYVYYSDSIDIYNHYKINHKQLPSISVLPQLLDQQYIALPINKFYPVSIKNELKLPINYIYNNGNLREQKVKNNPVTFGATYIYQVTPPSVDSVLTSIMNKQIRNKNKIDMNTIASQSQYFYPTQSSMKSSQIEEEIQEEDVSIIIFEVFASTESDLLPDPFVNEMNFIMCHWNKINNSNMHLDFIIIQNEQVYRQLITDEHATLSVWPELSVFIVQTELHMIKLFQLLVFLLDPDFLAGYDLEGKSLHYLVNRAEQYAYDLLANLSRGQASYDMLITQFDFDEFILQQPSSPQLQQLIDNYVYIKQTCVEYKNKRLSFNQDPKFSRKQNQAKKIAQTGRSKKVRYNMYIVGRVIINIWRNCATDYKLTDYSIENVYFSLFKRKTPAISNQTLSKWYNTDKSGLVYQYHLKRLTMSSDILELMGLIPRTIEIAKLYGCEYESVGFRGSQFKIESILNRVTKQNEFVLLAASRTQVATQKILECMPLVIEPPKMLSVDPVIVLDFQSLYPSIMIAYNLCYSTCLGNVLELFSEGGFKRFGVRNADLGISQLLQEFTIEQLIDKIIVTPNNVAFLKKEVREGIIPKILIEFLMTRIMIKKSTRHYDKYPKIQKQHSFKQLAIKLFMNVMYGYCGASFSGRMPSGDIADSVVEIGRTILNQCVDRIQNNPKWQARVLYGDTDSLFVMLKGKSTEQALLLGQQIALDCTSQYPYPIELKFEKVYESMFLVAKKRYVGYKVEKLGQDPVFDGKGLEMIRRDGCKAVQKIMTKTIKLLFDTKDLSLLKQYLNKQWAKILNGHYCTQDFIIAKEVKLGGYANPSRLPAHAIVAMKMIEKDPMKRPKPGERVPYIVIQGMDKKHDKVKDLVVSIEEFMSNTNYRLNTLYYIEKQINAAVGRLLSCVDIDINDWYSQMPKDMVKRDHMKSKVQFENATKSKATQFTLNHFFQQSVCLICHEESKQEICTECSKCGTIAMIMLNEKQKQLELQRYYLSMCCASCSNMRDVPCIEWSCPLVYGKVRIDTILKHFKIQANKYQELFTYFDQE